MTIFYIAVLIVFINIHSKEIYQFKINECLSKSYYWSILPGLKTEMSLHVFEGLGNKSPFIGSMSGIQSRKCGYLKVMPGLLNYLLKTLKGRFKKVAKQSIFPHHHQYNGLSISMEFSHMAPNRDELPLSADDITYHLQPSVSSSCQLTHSHFDCSVSGDPILISLSRSFTRQNRECICSCISKKQ